MKKVTLIIDGGKALKDCPTDWDEAKQWADKANGELESYEHPVWSWDCGFKLDYDGAILRFASRFYPPKTHYGDKWDGTVQVILFDTEVYSQEFECDTLEELQQAVERFTHDYVEKLRQALQSTSA